MSAEGEATYAGKQVEEIGHAGCLAPCLRSFQTARIARAIACRRSGDIVPREILASLADIVAE